MIAVALILLGIAAARLMASERWPHLDRAVRLLEESEAASPSVFSLAEVVTSLAARHPALERSQYLSAADIEFAARRAAQVAFERFGRV